MGGIIQAIFGGGGSSAPEMAPPPPPAAVAPPPKANSPSTQAAADTVAARAKASEGINSTVITGPKGLEEPAQTTNKQLLGS